MKFVVGLVSGVALGAAGAVYYTIKSGRDFRAIYSEVRTDLDNKNYDALGQRIEKGFAELQAEIEERLNQVRASTTAALEEAQVRVEEARANAEEVLHAEADLDAAPAVEDETVAETEAVAFDDVAADAETEAGSVADSAADTAETGSAFATESSFTSGFATGAADEATDTSGEEAAADPGADSESAGGAPDDRGTWYQER